MIQNQSCNYSDQIMNNACILFFPFIDISWCSRSGITWFLSSFVNDVHIVIPNK